MYVRTYKSNEVLTAYNIERERERKREREKERERERVVSGVILYFRIAGNVM